MSKNAFYKFIYAFSCIFLLYNLFFNNSIFILWYLAYNLSLNLLLNPMIEPHPQLQCNYPNGVWLLLLHIIAANAMPLSHALMCSVNIPLYMFQQFSNSSLSGGVLAFLKRQIVKCELKFIYSYDWYKAYNILFSPHIHTFAHVNCHPRSYNNI